MHAQYDDEPGGDGEDADDDDRGGLVDSVGRDADEEAAGRVAEVAPEAVYADGAARQAGWARSLTAARRVG